MGLEREGVIEDLGFYPSIDVSRILCFSSPRMYFEAKVSLTVEREAILPPFTGKVSKSLLIKGCDKLETIFKSPNINPKPIKVSPLGYLRNGREVYLWIRDGGKIGVAKAGPDREYFFYIGYEETVSHSVEEALSNIDGVELFGTKWYISNIEINSYTLPSSKISKYDISNSTEVKVSFRSPVNIVDPYRKSRYRRFLPIAGFLFSYNIGEIARLERDNKLYWILIDYISAVLQETHNVWNTVKKIHYIYDGEKIPGLTGYIKYYINHDLLENKPEITKLIENILQHAEIMGVGSGRANGFGHVKITVK